MNFLLGAFYYCTIFVVFNLIRITDAEEFNSEKYLAKYAKYIVYIRVKHGNIKHFIGGIIIEDNTILTSYAPIYFKRYGYVAAGIRKSTDRHERLAIKNIINLNSKASQLPQLALIKLSKRLTFSNRIADFKLPQSRHNVSDVCIVLTWQRMSAYVLTVHKVAIYNHSSSGVFCFEQYPPNATTDYCTIYSGGEPIICHDKLVGIVGTNGSCNSHNHSQATGVAENIYWIGLKLFETKSGCNNIAFGSSFGLFVFWIFIIAKQFLVI